MNSISAAAELGKAPYYPVFFPGTVNPAGYVEGDAGYDAASFWWASEKLHRKALWYFSAALDAVQPPIAEYEQEMLASVEGGKVPLNQGSINKYFAKAGAITREWGVTLDSLPLRKPNWLFRRYWQGYNKLNGI